MRTLYICGICKRMGVLKWQHIEYQGGCMCVCVSRAWEVAGVEWCEGALLFFPLSLCLSLPLSLSLSLSLSSSSARELPSDISGQTLKGSILSNPVTKHNTVVFSLHSTWSLRTSFPDEPATNSDRCLPFLAVSSGKCPDNLHAHLPSLPSLLALHPLLLLYSTAGDGLISRVHQELGAPAPSGAAGPPRQALPSD